MTKPGLLSVIDRIQQECAEPNWDSYRAAPVNPDSVAHAKRLIESLPDDLPLPSAVPEVNGCIDLEWYREGKGLVSVSVKRNGALSWVACIGEGEWHGVTDRWDEKLLGWVRKLKGEEV